MAYNNYYQKVVGFSKGNRDTCAEYNVNSCQWIDVAPGSEIPPPLLVSDVRYLLRIAPILMKTAAELRFLSNDIDSMLITKSNGCTPFCERPAGCIVKGCIACCAGLYGDVKCHSRWEINKFKDKEICSGTPRAGTVKERSWLAMESGTGPAINTSNHSMLALDSCM